MDDEKNPWWPHVMLATIIAGIFAASPFWVVGLPPKFAGGAALVIFPVVVTLYVLVMTDRI